jgi:hypothetical protein
VRLRACPLATRSVRLATGVVVDVHALLAKLVRDRLRIALDVFVDPDALLRDRLLLDDRLVLTERSPPAPTRTLSSASSACRESMDLT